MPRQKELKTVSIGSFHKTTDNILVVELFPDAVITLRNVEQISFEADALMESDKYGVMLDTRNHNTWEIPSEVLKYLSNNKYSHKQTAFAVVLNSLPMRIFARFFISFHKPVVPTKLFTSPERAKKWLISKAN